MLETAGSSGNIYKVHGVTKKKVTAVEIPDTETYYLGINSV